MCGIVHIREAEKKHGGVDIITELLHSFDKQRGRGTEGFGFVAIDKDRKHAIYERTEDEKTIKSKLRKLGNSSSEIMFHHRWPTSTANYAESAHPIRVENDELEYVYYGVHNGIIFNCDKLKTKHEKLGYAYTTEMETIIRGTHKGFDDEYWLDSDYNDSESLIIELARYIEGKSKKIETRGPVAFILLQFTKDGKPVARHFGRNKGNPLTYKHTNGYKIIASQGGKMLHADTWYTHDFETKSQSKHSVAIGQDEDFQGAYKTVVQTSPKGWEKDWDKDWSDPKTYSNITPTKPKQKSGWLADYDDMGEVMTDAQNAAYQDIIFNRVLELDHEIKKAKEDSNYDLECELTWEREKLLEDADEETLDDYKLSVGQAVIQID